MYARSTERAIEDKGQTKPGVDNLGQNSANSLAR